MKNPVIRAHVLLFLFILSPLAGAAEEACHSILADGFYQKYSRINPRVRDRAMYAELCSLDFEQARNAIKRARQSGDDGSLGLSYGLFNLDDLALANGVNNGGNTGKGTSNLPLTEDRFRQWKAGYCSKSSEADSSQAADFFMQKAVMENAESGKTAEAWSACMRKREGLACWASPHAQRGEEVLLNVNWTKRAASQSQTEPEVQYSFLTRGAASKFEGAAAKRIVPDGYKLKAGTVGIPITRPVDTAVFASLKVNDAGAEQSCKVFMPGDRDFTLSEPFINRMKLRYPG
ncbi:MAG: hypothetical protein KGM95_00710 [Betaproteobacteria bacterium]|nr:hypothetical protein [Betaproteobacteria bacterium]